MEVNNTRQIWSHLISAIYYMYVLGTHHSHSYNKNTLKELQNQWLFLGTSLVAQWLRICLPMQGTRVRSPVREDYTCRGATKPVCHNY